MRWLWLALAAIPAAIAYAALLGLGMHRHGNPWAISAAATVLAFAPPLAVAASSRRDLRWQRLGVGLAGWAVALWFAIPVYFPGERRDAVASGLALLGGDAMGRAIANGLPDEGGFASPEIPEAAVATAPAPLPPKALTESEIALPYEGEGRRLAVPVVLQHGGKTLEVYMMLDTGATYTTLPTRVLDELGARPGPEAPSIRLHTANGERDAEVALLDRVWLGDLAIDGVAIAGCDPCEGEDTVGLLGLNVAGGFNVTIDADRREVVFDGRDAHDRHLDIKPHSDLDATFTRYPGDRIEVEVRFANHSPRAISDAVAEIRCGSEKWQVTLTDIASGADARSRRRLPEHTPCDQYEISLESAHW